ncbi:hypothetical protein [Nonomuraea sp. NPDC049725]
MTVHAGPVTVPPRRPRPPLGKRETDQLRHALIRLREITDPYR